MRIRYAQISAGCLSGRPGREVLLLYVEDEEVISVGITTLLV
jgi:hypothetical protein